MTPNPEWATADHLRRKGPHRSLVHRPRSFKWQERNPGLTETKEIPDRGLSLTIDHGLRDVADMALEFIKHHG